MAQLEDLALVAPLPTPALQSARHCSCLYCTQSNQPIDHDPAAYKQNRTRETPVARLVLPIAHWDIHRGWGTAITTEARNKVLSCGHKETQQYGQHSSHSCDPWHILESSMATCVCMPTRFLPDEGQTGPWDKARRPRISHLADGRKSSCSLCTHGRSTPWCRGAKIQEHQLSCNTSARMSQQNICTACAIVSMLFHRQSSYTASSSPACLYVQLIVFLAWCVQTSHQGAPMRTARFPASNASDTRIPFQDPCDHTLNIVTRA
jgi:hypothetical protein